MFNNVREWLQDRTGIPGALNHFLNEPIPASAGWHQVFGSVALFAFLLQLTTGFLLALNYGATPAEAHASVRYIMTQLTGGPIIRGLHFWGASAMIVVVVLHMLQAFVWGAYKRPREVTWIVGCLLLLLTLGFGLTGYLLPWDNRAYWGTTVTTQIAALAPGAGPIVERLLGVENGAIGIVTFSRFYAAHVMLLPLITLGLCLLHVYLVRRHGVTPTPADADRPKKMFYPEQVFKDTFAIFLYVAVLGLLASFALVGLGSMADPTDTSYIPRPEWYFLFLFQMLKLFEGPLEIVGAVVLPTIAIIFLILTPFIDRGAAIRVRKRTFAIGLVLLGSLGWAGLTERAIATTPANTEDAHAGLKERETWREIPAEHLAAIGYFRSANCAECHVLGRSGMAPDLGRDLAAKPVDWMEQHFAKPTAAAAETNLTTVQIHSLVALVTKRDDKALDAWNLAPEEAIQGAILFQNRRCGNCHRLNGVGGNLGPPMNGLAQRRQRNWVMGHFAEPKKYLPESRMPSFQFEKQDLARITDYVMSIPK
ncbi:MAG: cytochrome b N-terminal domain-containing protein [Acidobacteriota bacterium]